MSAPTPKLKSNEVIEEVNLMLRDISHYLPETDPTVRRLLKEARESITANPAMGHSALACVYQLTGDFKQAQHHSDNALKLAGREDVLYLNKATTLINLGFFSDALAFYARAVDPERGFFTTAWQRGYVVGAFQTMKTALDKARAMQLDLSGLDFATAESAAEVLRKSGISELEVSKVLDVAGEVLRNHRLLYMDQSPEVTVFDGAPGLEPFIEISYKVGLDEEGAQSLYFEFIDATTARFTDSLSVLSVSFIASKKERERRAA